MDKVDVVDMENVLLVNPLVYVINFSLDQAAQNVYLQLFLMIILFLTVFSIGILSSGQELPLVENVSSLSFTPHQVQGCGDQLLNGRGGGGAKHVQ